MIFKKEDLPSLFENQLRPILFSAIPFMFFGLVSLNLALTNEPSWFSRLGSVMIIWAVGSLSVQREQHASAAARWERHRVTAHLNQMRQLDRMRQESLDLTFDIHATQIAQIATRVGLPNPFVEGDPQKLENFCKDVQRRMQASTVSQRSKEAVDGLRAIEDDYLNSMRDIDKWSRKIWRIEVVLLLWGTLQWGYGDLFIQWLHS